MRYLDFYNKYMKTGKLPSWGLCNCFIHDIEIFTPGGTIDQDNSWYWGYDGEDRIGINASSYITYRIAFTPLRQNIVLFLAAMNGEL